MLLKQPKVDGSHKHQLVVSSLGHRVLDVFLWSLFHTTSDRGKQHHRISCAARSASIFIARRQLPPHLQPIIVCLSGVPVACDGPTFLFLASTQRTVSMFPPGGCLPPGGWRWGGASHTHPQGEAAELARRSVGKPSECLPVTGTQLGNDKKKKLTGRLDQEGATDDFS